MSILWPASRDYDMDQTRAATAIADSEVQASLLLAVGSLIWKWVSVAANVDFLLQINEEKFAVMFEFLQNIGWLVLALGGFAWTIIRFSTQKSVRQAPSWSTVVAAAILAFMFGILLAVRSTGNVPNLITGWGADQSSCHVTFDTNRLASFRANYKIALACGITDPTKDKLDDDGLTISNALVTVYLIERSESFKLLALPQLFRRLKWPRSLPFMPVVPLQKRLPSGLCV
jgi:hypothetical protein